MTTIYALNKQTGETVMWRTLPHEQACTLARLWRTIYSQHKIILVQALPQMSLPL